MIITISSPFTTLDTAMFPISDHIHHHGLDFIYDLHTRLHYRIIMIIKDRLLICTVLKKLFVCMYVCNESRAAVVSIAGTVSHEEIIVFNLE